MQFRLKFRKVVASEICKGVECKKVGWHLARHNLKAKTHPKLALLTANFRGGFGFSLNDKSIDA